MPKMCLNDPLYVLENFVNLRQKRNCALFNTWYKINSI